jgi:predicted dehydrogenase
VEGVVLTTPHTLHAEQVVAAAQAGKHVFVEKPLALSTADAIRAAAASRQAGIVLAVGHHRRRQGANRRLKAILHANGLGVPLHAEGNLSAWAPAEYQSGSWRARRSESPVGGMAGMGIHHVDTLQYLLGPIVRVMAMSKRLAATVDLDDTTAALFEFRRGPLGSLGTCLVAPRVLYLNVYGTEANAFSEGEGEKLFLQSAGQADRIPVPIQPVDALQEEMEDFARAVRKEGTYEVSPDDAIRAVAVCEAIMRSSETGQSQDVSQFPSAE